MFEKEVVIVIVHMTEVLFRLVSGSACELFGLFCDILDEIPG